MGDGKDIRYLLCMDGCHLNEWLTNRDEPSDKERRCTLYEGKKGGVWQKKKSERGKGKGEEGMGQSAAGNAAQLQKGWRLRNRQSVNHSPHSAIHSFTYSLIHPFPVPLAPVVFMLTNLLHLFLIYTTFTFNFVRSRERSDPSQSISAPVANPIPIQEDPDELAALTKDVRPRPVVGLF